jgi:hypothetical protein
MSDGGIAQTVPISKRIGFIAARGVHLDDRVVIVEVVDPTVTPELKRAPLPAWRAAAFAVMSVGLGLAGHQLASGTAVPLWLMAAALAVGLAYGRLLAIAKLDWFGVAAGATAIQLGIHLVASSLHGTPAAAHAHHVATGTAHDGVSAALLSSMLVFHVVATVIGVVLLLALERRLWNGVCSAVAFVARAIRGGADVQFEFVAAASARRLVSVELPAMRASALASVATRRGPPVLLVA